MHVLILGGTSEASALTKLLAERQDIIATLSLAGRTRDPILPSIPYRIGGFGGVQGLSRWICEHKVTALIDATHPFARRMPFNIAQAASKTGIPLLSLLRPQWQADRHDRWTEVADHSEAIALLGNESRRIFLTVGRLEIAAYALAPQHFYLVRSIDEVAPKPLRNAKWICARAPFDVNGETALMSEHRIDILITKNSGGSATEAKLIAARKLNLPVILIARPGRPEAERVTTAEQALQWVADVHSVS